LVLASSPLSYRSLSPGRAGLIVKATTQSRRRSPIDRLPFLPFEKPRKDAECQISSDENYREFDNIVAVVRLEGDVRVRFFVYKGKEQDTKQSRRRVERPRRVDGAASNKSATRLSSLFGWTTPRPISIFGASSMSEIRGYSYVQNEIAQEVSTSLRFEIDAR